MKIHVVFTGGTIGSSVSGGVISPADSSKSVLLENYIALHGNDVSFETAAPYFALSENLCAENLNSLVRCVCGIAENGGEKIIVCHGTDTLQFSAAALSYALAGTKACAVLVSANYPLSDSRSNGFANFEAAVDFLKNNNSRGVRVSYKNIGDECAGILDAAHLLTYPEGSAFLAEKGYFALDNNENFVKNKASEKSKNDAFACKECSAKAASLADFGIDGVEFPERSDVLVLQCVPGCDYNFNVSEKKAVILRPYHSGTLNTASLDFQKFCAACKEKNIPVFAASVPEGDIYESSCAFDFLGIIPLDLTFSNAYIRAWLAPFKGESLSRFMQANIAL